MSTNRKNRNIYAPLSNFTTNIEYRTVIVPRSKYNEFAPILSYVINEVNRLINKLNISINTRLISYIICNLVTNDALDFTNSRIAFVSSDVNEPFPTVIDRSRISHMLEFLISPAYEQITFSSTCCDAKFVIDKNYISSAMTDIFLDLVMFNSYSFLKSMSVSEKINFSKRKFKYFKDNNLSCFYDYDDSDILLYYSLAFSARKNRKEIDMDKYIFLWNDFINKYYSADLNNEEPISLQLKKYIDYKQLPCDKILIKFDSLPKGAYILIKVNKIPRSIKIIHELEAIFPGNTLSCEKWKIMPLSKYKSIEKYAKNLYISVFKIIKYH